MNGLLKVFGLNLGNSEQILWVALLRVSLLLLSAYKGGSQL